jgi:peptidoglycan/xylan/chitin deacetylase (PgdA/CDA1 family)
MSALVISLDFELFWGVTDSRTVENYGANIEGVWQAVPAMLALFKKYGIHVTWATVGMLMCKDFKQWSDLRPSIMPTYGRESCSTYSVSALARDLPKLFFARPLVEQILATDGQELASHTYSHFYCGETDSTVEQFIADLECNQRIFDEYQVKPTSLVFPRNQVRDEYLNSLLAAGFTAYRGNQNHWMYKDGHFVSGSFGKALRLIRFVDTYIPITGSHTFSLPTDIPQEQLINIPASQFLRPVSTHALANTMHLNRVKSGMKKAAMTNSVFHLWWHPHNFGRNLEASLMNLNTVLKYYRELNNEYGMQSFSMREVERISRIN